MPTRATDDADARPEEPQSPSDDAGRREAQLRAPLAAFHDRVRARASEATPLEVAAWTRDGRRGLRADFTQS